MGRKYKNMNEYVDMIIFYQLRAAVQLLLYKVDVPTIVAYIYDLYEEYLISDEQESVLYRLADSEEKFNSHSEYWNNLDISSDENPLYQIAIGKKEVEILDKEVAA